MFADAVAHYLYTISFALGGRDKTHGLLNVAGLQSEVSQAADGLVKNHINQMIAPLIKTAGTLNPSALAAHMQAANKNLYHWIQSNPMIASPEAGAPAGPPAGGGGAIFGAPVPVPPPPGR